MKQILLAFFLLSTIQIVSAQTELSLMGAIENALENNYDIRIRQMDEQIAELNNNWGTAGRYPSVALSLNSNNKSDFNDTENYEQYQLLGGVNLNWTLFDGFKVNITKHKLEELENLTKGYTAVLVEGTVQAMMMAYYQVLLQQEVLEVYLINAQLSKDRFDYEQMRKELGNVVSYEVLQAQNSYLADQSDVLIQKANVMAVKRDLAYLMGQEKVDFELTDTFLVDYSVVNVDELKISLFENNKTLQNQYINQSLLSKEIAMAKAGLYPRLAMSAGAQMSNLNQNYTTLPDVSSSGSNLFGNFTLSYNLFNGGVRKRAIQISTIKEDIGFVEIEDMKVSLLNQLESLVDYYNARKSVLDLSVERLKVAQINLDISEEKLKAGTINSFNYRDVQLSYQNSALARLNALYNFLDTKTSIQRLSGQIIQEN